MYAKLFFLRNACLLDMLSVKSEKGIRKPVIH